MKDLCEKASPSRIPPARNGCSQCRHVDAQKYLAQWSQGRTGPGVGPGVGPCVGPRVGLGVGPGVSQGVGPGADGPGVGPSEGQGWAQGFSHRWGQG